MINLFQQIIIHKGELSYIKLQDYVLNKHLYNIQNKNT